MPKGIASTSTAIVQWLSLTRSGEKVLDFTCEETSFRLQTRTDGGLDLVLVGKDSVVGTICHIKCDMAAAVFAISECLASHKFEGVSEAVPSFMVRGRVDTLSEELSKETTSLASVPQDAARLNREKWEREVNYLERLLEVLGVAASNCKGTLSSFGRRVLRGRA